MPDLLEPTAATDVFCILPSLLFSSLSQWGCDCLSQAGQAACRASGMEVGRGTKRRGRRWGGGQRRGAYPALSRVTTFTLGMFGFVTGLCGVIRPPARRAYVPVPKNRVELGRPSALGRRAEAAAPARQCRRARSGACR